MCNVCRLQAELQCSLGNSSSMSKVWEQGSGFNPGEGIVGLFSLTANLREQCVCRARWLSSWGLRTQAHTHTHTHLVLRVVSWDGGGSRNVIGGVEQSSGHLDIGNSIKFRIYYFSGQKKRY